MLGAVVVVGFAAAGADPYAQLLLWVNTPGMIGLMVLQLLAAVAVFLFFRKIPHGEGVLRTVVAPLVAAVLLAGAIGLVSYNVELFTGASTGVNVVLVSLVPGTFLLGLLLARRLKRRRPEVYASFAAEPADAPEGTPEPASATSVTR